MSTTATANFLHLSHLIPIGQAALIADDIRPTGYNPGQYTYARDDFGFKIYMYVRNLQAAAVTIGQGMRRVADVAVAAITSSTASSITKAAAFSTITVGGLTVSKHAGMILHTRLNGSVAGAAPEAEIALISSGTAGTLNFDPDYLPSVAIPATSNVDIISPGWHVELGAVGDPAVDVKGVVVAGISQNNFGWVQCYGIVPRASYANVANTARNPLVMAATGTVTPTGQNTSKTIGYALGVVNVGLTSALAPMFINVYSPISNTTVAG